MSELNVSNLKKEHVDEGPDLVGVTELTSPYFMVPPSGTTVERPENPEPGTLRFNTDIGRLEYFRGNDIGWTTIVGKTPNLGGGTGSNLGTGTRGVAGGGNDGSYVNTIDYWTIPTLGNAQDFGDRTVDLYAEACASSTRALFGGGVVNNTIDYVTFSSTGNAADFGDLSYAPQEGGAGGNETRGIWAGGYSTSPNAQRNIISYVTISHTGNGVDFGDLTGARTGCACAASTTRLLTAGGQQDGGPSHDNVIDYITIMSTGNAIDFGDITSSYLVNLGGAASSTRAVWMGGGIAAPTYAAQNVIDFNTIATLGNAVDFGDLQEASKHHSACSSQTRAMIAGGSSGDTDLIQYITIATTGNSTDFGNLTVGRYGAGVTSNGHGGLG